MAKNNYRAALIPVIIFIGLLFLLRAGLNHDPRALPTELAGQPVPEFSLNELLTQQQVSNADLPEGPYLLNVWGTWCASCYIEHPFLVELAKNKTIDIVGINHKDDRDAAIAYLKKYEDPFVMNLFDPKGRMGINLGVYGAPETFLVGKDGQIKYRHVGVLDERVWQEKFVPLLGQTVDGDS